MISYLMLTRTLLMAFAATMLVSFSTGAETLSGHRYLESPGSTRPGMGFWIYHPVSMESDEKGFPMMVFLHGGGEGGGAPEVVKKHGPPKLIDQGKQFPCIVISPRNPSRTQYWDDQQLIELIDHVVETNDIDQSRIYLTGMSRGCFGGWRLLIQNPRRFAAFVGVCGGGPAPYAGRVSHVPIRLFHGAEDTTIPVIESERMFRSHRDAGGDCELTVYPKTGHNAWDQTYADDKMYTWMFSKRAESEEESEGR